MKKLFVLLAVLAICATSVSAGNVKDDDTGDGIIGFTEIEEFEG